MKFASATVDCFEPIKPCKGNDLSKGFTSQMSPTVVGLMAAGLALGSWVFPFPGEEGSEGALDSMWDVALMIAFAVGAAAAKHFRDGKQAWPEKAVKKMSEDAGMASPKQDKLLKDHAPAASATSTPPGLHTSSRSSENSATAYNIHIDRHAKEGDIAGAERWMKEMVNAGVEPNTVTYNSLIHSCARAGDFAKAEMWLRRMMKAGVEMNAISYNAVLDACAKAGNVERAEQWLKKMLADGIAANVVSYSTVIHACAKAGEVASAEEWLKKMRQAGGCENPL